MARPRIAPKRIVALPASLTQWPGYVMKYVFEAWYTTYEQEIANVGLSVNGFLVLVVLDDEGPDTQTRLAERLSIDRSAMVAVVDELEEKGYVERRRSKGDRRTVPVHVTKLGSEAAARARAATDASNHRIFAGFSPKDEEVFYDLLVRMADSAAPAPETPGNGAGIEAGDELGNEPRKASGTSES
jgi:DNA-binding MarR family transcriptional regulator